MTSGKCPLCGEEMEISKVLNCWYCNNQRCGVVDRTLDESELLIIKSQISKIKEDAKKEVIDDFEGITCQANYSCNNLVSYTIPSKSIQEWKKKHLGKDGEK